MNNADALTDEQIRTIENDQAKMPGTTRDNLTTRTVRAALIAQHGFCRDEDHCTCAREFGYRVCQPSPVEQHEAAPAGDIATLIAYAEGSKSAAVVNACRRVAAWQANAGQHEATPADTLSRALLEGAKQ